MILNRGMKFRVTERRLGAHIALGLIVAISMIACMQAAPPTAVAAERPELFSSFPSPPTSGSAAGKLGLPQAVAVDPTTGNVYVADYQNIRIDEFTAFGEFVRAIGWGVRDGSPELQTCTLATTCRAGVSGTKPGQFKYVSGLTVDSLGNVYLFDFENSRLTKFNPDGTFSLMVGGGVNGTTGADLCTAADLAGGDICGAGTPGSGPSEFEGNSEGAYVAVGPGDIVYVGDKDRIQQFTPDGTFKAQLPLPEEGKVQTLAVDTNGDVYLALNQNFAVESPQHPFVYKLDSSGKVLDQINLGFPVSLAVDSESSLWVVEGAGTFRPRQIFQFDAAGTQLIPDQEEIEKKEEEEAKEKNGEPFERFEQFGEPPPNVELVSLTTSSACNPLTDDVYAVYFSGTLAYLNAFGPPPQDTVKCPPPPPQPPEIATQFVGGVSAASATVRGQINPKFATDTTYFVEYGTAKCSEGGCTQLQPQPPGELLTSKIANSPIATKGTALTSLLPSTTYYYRLVAENSAGGPVRGVGGTVGSDGAEGSFTTAPTRPDPRLNCPNQVFRIGASAYLTDCRAYELVSPAVRSGGGIIANFNLVGRPAELNQSAVDGEKITYSSEFAFGDAVSAPNTSQYIATRDSAQGWLTRAISPPQNPGFLTDSPTIKFDSDYKAFSENLCSGWLLRDTEPRLGPAAPLGFVSLNRRSNCGLEGYQAITTAAPLGVKASLYWPEIQGLSTDGSRAVFRANGELTPDAPPIGEPEAHPYQLYYSEAGNLRFLCILPDGTPYVGPCSAGTPNSSTGTGRANTVESAVNADATRVYWSAASDSTGPLYLRENAGQEQSAITAGKCIEPEKACTYSVSGGAAAHFWAASADGSIAFYTVGGALREYNAQTQKSKLVAEGSEGAAAASEDGAAVYFVSKEVLGGKGAAGQPNLFLRTEGKTRLVATLSPEDTTPRFKDIPITPVGNQPFAGGTRVTPDGRHLIFASTASLTDYDNTDGATGTPTVELYIYDAEGAEVHCISCNPTDAQPEGRKFFGTSIGKVIPFRMVAALVAPHETQLYAPKVLTADGDRFFFNSYESLVARDVNGKADVYEWERAPDAATCSALGAELYVESAVGCLSLISTGEDSGDSEFVDSSQGGRDVFFKTYQSLLGQDKGRLDIYDAREGGGLPEPLVQGPGCVGEACRPPSPPPNIASPAPPTVFPGNRKPKCPKGTHRVTKKGKSQCVKNKRAKKQGKGKRQAQGKGKGNGKKQATNDRGNR